MSFEPTKVIEIRDGKQIGQTMIQTAKGIPYDNTDSGLTAGNLQDAVDELNTDLTDKVNPPNWGNSTVWKIRSEIYLNASYTTTESGWYYFMSGGSPNGDYNIKINGDANIEFNVKSLPMVYVKAGDTIVVTYHVDGSNNIILKL